MNLILSEKQAEVNGFVFFSYLKIFLFWDVLLQEDNVFLIPYTVQRMKQNLLLQDNFSF